MSSVVEKEALQAAPALGTWRDANGAWTRMCLIYCALHSLSIVASDRHACTIVLYSCPKALADEVPIVNTRNYATP